jgi:hypothetical protein
VNVKRITRIEVIDKAGRSYVNWDEDNDVTYQLQDDGRTLKVFVNTHHDYHDDIAPVRSRTAEEFLNHTEFGVDPHIDTDRVVVERIGS